MKRNIITINHEKCNGCGACVPDCPEGALQIIDGKARLISDLFCDGLGACIKACPTDAMHIETRETEPYDERKVMKNIIAQGPNTIKAHLLHLKEHGETSLLAQAIEALHDEDIPVPSFEQPHHAGCPGAAMRDMRNKAKQSHEPSAEETGSELTQWPVQLKLVNPGAPYFDTSELLVSADCVAFAFGDFHRKFLRGKPLVIFCPKLDSDLEHYTEKLAAIFSEHPIERVSVVRMEVPCCGGTLKITEDAVLRSGKRIIIREYVISIDGSIR